MEPRQKQLTAVTSPMFQYPLAGQIGWNAAPTAASSAVSSVSVPSSGSNWVELTKKLTSGRIGSVSVPSSGSNWVERDGADDFAKREVEVSVPSSGSNWVEPPAEVVSNHQNNVVSVPSSGSNWVEPLAVFHL